MSERLPTVIELTAFFLRASRQAGYVSGRPGHPAGGLLGPMLCATYDEGSLHYVETWVKGPVRANGRYLIEGHAFIMVDDVGVVWTTHFSGWLLADLVDVEAFLVRAMKAANYFYAGRGLVYVREGTMIYTNSASDPDTIELFACVERILVSNRLRGPECVYSMSIRGGTIVDLPLL